MAKMESNMESNTGKVLLAFIVIGINRTIGIKTGKKMTSTIAKCYWQKRNQQLLVSMENSPRNLLLLIQNAQRALRRNSWCSICLCQWTRTDPRLLSFRHADCIQCE
jgi:hypothetical protein